MKLRVSIYSPDRHILYEGSTPDVTGVGGGITVRIRIAQALARQGHEVTVICNCPASHTHAGVHYLPLDAATRIDADALVLHTTGGGVDLRPLLAVDVRARLQILFLDGAVVPLGSQDIRLDAVYPASNFLRQALAAEFPRMFVTYHGVVHRAAETLRDRGSLYRLVYASHPSKGLGAAIEVLRLLRLEQPEAELHVCGGNRLWGGADDPPPPVAGVVYHGLIGQDEVIEQYRKASFAMQLQNRLEPFGLTLVESMAMGCIPVASPAGAYAELVHDGWDGIVIPGDAESPAAHRAAADAILRVARDNALVDQLRRRATAAPLTWDTVAQTWEAHWEILTGKAAARLDGRVCRVCAGPHASYPDGSRCTQCGSFFGATAIGEGFTA